MTDPAADAPSAPEVRPDFPVSWADASDAELTWDFDDMHTPFCLSPLAWDYGHVVGQGFRYRYDRMDLGIEVRARVVNGYLYFAYQDFGLYDVYVVKKREHTALAAAYWRRAVPELRSLYGWISEVPVDELPAIELAEAWEGAWRRTERAWRIHFYA